MKMPVIQSTLGDARDRDVHLAPIVPIGKPGIVGEEVQLDVAPAALPFIGPSEMCATTSATSR